MPDNMDRIQELCLREQEEAAARCTMPATAGRDDCEGCGEFIHPTRKKLGAQLCFDCQTIVEARARR
jgi:RNA polymerase-binding transcription factor DksA